MENYTTEQINEVAEDIFNKIKTEMIFDEKTVDSLFLQTTNAVNELLDQEGHSTVTKWHHATGTRDVKKIDPDSLRESFNVVWKMRVGAYYKAGIQFVNPQDVIELNHKTGELLWELRASEVYLLPNNEGIYLEPPVEQHLVDTEDGLQMHCTTGPYIKYRDGSKMYAVEDVTSVPEWVVMSKPEDMDPKEVLALENADHRRIALNKMGIEKMIEFGELIDEVGDRKLLDMRVLFDDEKALYLSMINPSNGQTHLEGVDNDCENVQDARDFRSGVKGWNPLYIDGVQQIDGNEGQQQQGDVCIEECQDLDVSDKPLLNKKTLLSDENQKRHTITGGKLYGDEDRQLWLIDKQERIVHPEHGPNFFWPGLYEIWAVVEQDHVNNELRTVID